MPDPRRVHVAYAENGSYGRPPFDPPTHYPELGALAATTDSSNTAYDVVRRALRSFDADRFGRADWNPLGEIIRPGETVVLKPNLVMHDWKPGLELRTHPAVVRALADYVCLALEGLGRVIVCDCPIQGADFERLARESHLRPAIESFRGRTTVSVELLDLRTEWARVDDSSGFIVERRPLAGDPAGNSRFDLGSSSALIEPGWNAAGLSVGDYGAGMMTRSHSDGRHEYQFGNTVFTADVVLSIAKMKTHQKAGVTGALKNTVGMTTAKDGLPHYRTGGAPNGDEYPAGVSNRTVARGKRWMQERVPLAVWRISRRLALATLSALGRVSRGSSGLGLIGGGWEGNDTVWRMVLDINRIFQFGRSDGTLAAQPQRRAHFFIDGIVGGEGDGPLKSTPRYAGVVLHGSDAVAVDVAMAWLMGYDPERVPLLRRAIADYPPSPSSLRRMDDLEVWCDGALMDRLERRGAFAFRPPRGWPGLASSPDRAWLSQRFVRWP